MFGDREFFSVRGRGLSCVRGECPSDPRGRGSMSARRFTSIVLASLCVVTGRSPPGEPLGVLCSDEAPQGRGERWWWKR